MSNPFDTIDARLDVLERQNAKLIDLLSSRKEPEELLTPDEAAALLKISKPTLWRWGKSGKLRIYGLGGARYFRKTEIFDSLKNSK
jgi:excisionase family DNA binding protein